MDPMNSIWYFLEYQRQSSATDSAAELSVNPPVRGRMTVKGGLIELGVPLFVLAVLVTFGVVCFLCPTFLS